MKKILFAAWIAIAGVPIPGPAFGQPANDNREDFEVLFGEAVIASDSWGRIAIALDTLEAEDLPPDGRMDHLFLFSPRNPVERNFFLAVDTVNVAFSKQRIVLTSPDSPVRIDLSVGKSGRAEERNFLTQSIRIPDGLELIHSYGIFETNIRNFSPADFPVIYPDNEIIQNDGRIRACDGVENCSGARFFGGPKCKTGGAGASGCEVKCSQSTGCGVSCQEGSYACCNCWIPTGPKCECIPLP
jgi:hypothetical protein